MTSQQLQRLTRAEQISRDLRRGHDPDLARRRGVVALSLAAAGSMGLVALYQTGIIRHLPDPPLRHFDADRVDAAGEAYGRLSTPDALLGLHSYSTTAVLAAMGGADRAKRLPWVPLALAGKAAFDAAVAGKLTWDQWAKHKAWCAWCLIAAACTFGILPLVWPEARRALRELRGKPTWAAEVRSAVRTVRRVRSPNTAE